MSNLITRRMIEAYSSEAAPTMALSGLFRSPPENHSNQEEVELDLMRSDEHLAVVISDKCTGYNENSADLFQSKTFKPAIYKESIAVNSCDLATREFGVDPFKNTDFRANLISRIFRNVRKVEAKIKRAIELQASQVLTTGVLDLVDANGVTKYSLDFQPTASHFPTAAVAWNLPGATIIADINALAEEIRNDGLEDADQIIMGQASFDAFLADPAIQALFDNRRIMQGEITTMPSGSGGLTRQGSVNLGAYRFELLTYGGRYVHPQTGLKVKYLQDDKVIVRSSSGRMDALFGNIPHIGTLLGNHHGNLLPELPGRLSSDMTDLFVHSWISADGQTLWAGVGSRPLMVPTALDTYGCITTGV